MMIPVSMVAVISVTKYFMILINDRKINTYRTEQAGKGPFFLTYHMK